MKVPIESGRYVMLNSGCELIFVGKPHGYTPKEQRNLVDDVVGAIASAEYEAECDTLHMLCVDKDGLELSDFSGGFIDDATIIADESYEDDKEKEEIMKRLLE